MKNRKNWLSLFSDRRVIGVFSMPYCLAIPMGSLWKKHYLTALQHANLLTHSSVHSPACSEKPASCERGCKSGSMWQVSLTLRSVNVQMLKMLLGTWHMPIFIMLLVTHLKARFHICGSICDDLEKTLTFTTAWAKSYCNAETKLTGSILLSPNRFSHQK